MAAAKGQHVFLTGVFVVTIFGRPSPIGARSLPGAKAAVGGPVSEETDRGQPQSVRKEPRRGILFAEKVRPTVQYARFMLLDDAGRKRFSGEKVGSSTGPASGT